MGIMGGVANRVTLIVNRKIIKNAQGEGICHVANRVTLIVNRKLTGVSCKPKSDRIDGRQQGDFNCQ